MTAPASTGDLSYVTACSGSWAKRPQCTHPHMTSEAPNDEWHGVPATVLVLVDGEWLGGALCAQHSHPSYMKGAQ